MRLEQTNFHDRKGRRMNSNRRRLGKASVALGAAGAGLALTAGPAAASAGALQVTPTTNLHDGQSVSVYWDTGLPWGTSGFIGQAGECSVSVPAGLVLDGSFLNHCDASVGINLDPVRASDGDLAYQGKLTAKKSLQMLAGAVTCTNQCTIVMRQFFRTPEIRSHRAACRSRSSKRAERRHTWNRKKLQSNMRPSVIFT